MQSYADLLRRNPAFRRLFLASVVSLAGDWFSFVAVADLVIELTGSAGAAAYTYAATVIPVFLASPIAGAVADKFDRRRVLVISDLLRVPVALSLCLAGGSMAVAILAVIGLGIGASFYDPAAAAATPNLVDAEDLSTANALMGAVWGSMLLVGAGLGGLVAELAGRNAAFIVDGLSFLVSAWLVSGIRRPMQEPRVVDSTGYGEVFRYARSSPFILRLLFAKVGVSSANGTVGLLPAFARARWGGIATGLLFAARGLGAMLGPILARVGVGAEPSPRAIVWICGLSNLSYALAYTAIPWAPWLGLAIALVIVAHLGGGAQWALSAYGLQTAAPDHLRGRVMSLDYGIATLAIGASAIVAGLLADAYGAAASTWILSSLAATFGISWIAWSAGAAARA